MPHIRIVAVTRWNSKDPLIAGCEEYLSRLKRFHQIETQIIKPGKQSHEHKRISDILAKQSSLYILLDQGGTAFSSEQLAENLKHWSQHKHGAISFIIGGAYGVNSHIKSQADHIWSLSNLTLPHRIALLTVCEQIYRAYTIIQGMPYHHG